jgi:hypothetical protein
MTLVPRSYFHKLGMIELPSNRGRLRTVSGHVDVLVGSLDLELRSARLKYRWSARVGFVSRADNIALLGHAGFLDHFSATFDGLRKCVTLKAQEPLPVPVFGVK